MIAFLADIARRYISALIGGLRTPWTEGRACPGTFAMLGDEGYTKSAGFARLWWIWAQVGFIRPPADACG